MNLDTYKTASVGTGSIGTPSFCLKGIPKEDESNVKDSVTFGLLSKRPTAGEEASGSREQPMLSKMEEFKVYPQAGDDIVIQKKTEEKGGLSMGPMVTSGWESKDYSAPIEEIVSLVGKSMGMPLATSGDFLS